MGDLAVDIKDLQFGYPGQSPAFFSGFNLEIPRGERFGLFGPNGSGKTTLIGLMTGLLPFHEGSIRIFGHEIKKKNNHVNTLFGFVPQELSYYQELSPSENLEFFGAWSGLGRQDIRTKSKALFGILGLSDVRNKPVQQLSGGMKRRVNLAIAVLTDPPLLFLDEPTVAVDVQTRLAIIDYLKNLNQNGTTLVYTSHQLNEAEELCNTIALLDEGKILVHDRLDKLLAEHQQQGLESLFINLTSTTTGGRHV